MKVLLVVNPVAAGANPETRSGVEAALGGRHDLEVVETERRGHATELAASGVAAGAEVVVVLAGDGTLNEAANGVVGTGTALAGLPGGSTNVFARTLGVPRRAEDAVEALLAELDRARFRSVGTGTANGRHFLFHVGMGYDAAVVAQVEGRPKRLKQTFGQLVFAEAAIETWLCHYERGRPRLAVYFEDGRVEDGCFAICLNSDPYTFVGRRPLTIAPEATLDRGLAMVTLRSLDLVPTLAVVLSALGSGARARSHPGTDYRHDLASVTVRGHGPFPYQVDGDLLGETEELVLAHHPEALLVVAPGGEGATGPT